MLVTVFKSKRAMYAYCRKHCVNRPALNYDAVVHSFKVVTYLALVKQNSKSERLNLHAGIPASKVVKVKPIFAEMHITVRAANSMNIVTHESGHAALAWFRRKYPKCDDLGDMNYEEKLCYGLGHIGKEIVRRTMHLWSDG